MTESLDLEQVNPAYLCGRLLAVYEGLQYQAHRDKADPSKSVNVSVTDRYFGAASTYPALAFPKLATLARAHVKRLRRDRPRAARAIESKLDDLVESFGPVGFPRHLNVEDQGRFVVGYHHQRAEDARAIRAHKAKSEQEK